MVAQQTLRAYNLFLTTKSQGVPGTHLIGQKTFRPSQSKQNSNEKMALWNRMLLRNIKLLKFCLYSGKFMW